MISVESKTKKKKQREARDPIMIPERVSVVLSLSSLDDYSSVVDDYNDDDQSDLSNRTELEGLSELLMVDMQKETAADVVRAMCRLASNLLTNQNLHCEDYAKEALILGAHTVVFLAMKKWELHEQLQRAGCSCILLLARYMRNTVVASGGIISILRAMKNHPSSKLVQRSGCAALASCYVKFYSAPNQVHKKLHQFITDDNNEAIQMVVAAMERFPMEPDIQDIGCRFLCNLSRSRSFCEVMRKTHALSAISTAHEKHPNHEAILFCAQKFTTAMLK